MCVIRMTETMVLFQDLLFYTIAEGTCVPSEVVQIVGRVGSRVQGGSIYLLRACFPEHDILDKGSLGAVERGESQNFASH